MEKLKLLSTQPSDSVGTFFRPFKLIGESEWVCSDDEEELRLIDVEFLENLDRYESGSFFSPESPMKGALYPHDVYGEYTADQIKEGLSNFINYSITDEDLIDFWKDNNLEKLIFNYMTK